MFMFQRAALKVKVIVSLFKKNFASALVISFSFNSIHIQVMGQYPERHISGSGCLTLRCSFARECFALWCFVDKMQLCLMNLFLVIAVKNTATPQFFVISLLLLKTLQPPILCYFVIVVRNTATPTIFSFNAHLFICLYRSSN